MHPGTKCDLTRCSVELCAVGWSYVLQGGVICTWDRVKFGAHGSSSNPSPFAPTIRVGPPPPHAEAYPQSTWTSPPSSPAPHALRVVMTHFPSNPHPSIESPPSSPAPHALMMDALMMVMIRAAAYGNLGVHIRVYTGIWVYTVLYSNILPRNIHPPPRMTENTSFTPYLNK